MQTLRAACLVGTLALASSLVAQQPLPPRVIVQAPPPSTPDTSAPSGAIRVSGGVMAGQLISRVDPIYPDTDAQGTVVLHAIIGRDGTVQQLTVISGPPPLRDAAVEAVRQWTYTPFLLNGEPRAVDTTVTVNFKH